MTARLSDAVDPHTSHPAPGEVLEVAGSRATSFTRVIQPARALIGVLTTRPAQGQTALWPVPNTINKPLAHNTFGRLNNLRQSHASIT